MTLTIHCVCAGPELVARAPMPFIGCSLCNCRYAINWDKMTATAVEEPDADDPDVGATFVQAADDSDDD